jgi:hypothetical protein
MKMFIPAVGYRIKLTDEWKFSLHLEHRNDTLLALVVKDIQEVIHDNSDRFVGQNYDSGYRYIACSMPAGTVLEVDRVFVKTMNKTASVQDDCDSLTFKVIEHPTFDVKKKIRFWTKLSDVNNIDYELPPDHAAGKLEAFAKSKQPKKLTPDKIRELVSSDIFHSSFTGRRPQKSKWCTPKFIKECKTLEAEHTRLFFPYETARNQDYADKSRAELEEALARGTISIPVSLSGKIKTVDDIVKHMPNSGWADNLTPSKPRMETWDQIVTSRILGRFGNKSTVKSQPLASGGRRRTFFAAKRTEYAHNKGEPDISNFWVAVDTDPTDTEIINVEAGIAAVTTEPAI